MIKVYQCPWTTGIELYKPHEPLSLEEKIKKIALYALQIIPRIFFEPIVRLFVMPSTTPLFRFLTRFRAEDADKYVEIFARNNQNQIEKINFISADGTLLSGHYLTNPNNTKTILMFYGNASFYQQSLTRGLDVKFNFLFVNPRGVAETTNSPANKTTLLLDAEAAFQYLIHEKKVPEKDIYIYGHSLGGAQAALLKSLHGETGGKLILDRTFSKMDRMAEHFCKRIFGPTLLTPLIQKIAKAAISFFDWDYDTSSVITSIKDQVYIFNHDSDHIIPKELSLGEGLSQPNVTVVRSNIFLGNFHFEMHATDFSCDPPKTDSSIIEGMNGFFNN